MGIEDLKVALVFLCLSQLAGGLKRASADSHDCPAHSPPHASSHIETDEGVPDVRSFLSDYLPYQAIESDSALNRDFLRYIRCLAALKVPDAEFVLRFIDSEEKSIEALSLIHHEKVEFKEWLSMGHKLDNILAIDYYRKHYESVYPIAHARAMRAEMAILGHYAIKRGFFRVPKLAFGLVTPMVEQRQETVARIARRLRYNPEYLKQTADIDRRDLLNAVRVFSEGGYDYLRPKRIIKEALRYLKTNIGN